MKRRLTCRCGSRSYIRGSVATLQFEDFAGQYVCPTCHKKDVEVAREKRRKRQEQKQKYMRSSRSPNVKGGKQ